MTDITQANTLIHIIQQQYMQPLLTQPFDAHCCHMGTAIKHPVPDQVK